VGGAAGNATADNKDARRLLFVRFHGHHPTAKALSGSKVDAMCSESGRSVIPHSPGAHA